MKKYSHMVSTDCTKGGEVITLFCLASQIPTQKKKKNYMYLIIAFYIPNALYTSRNYSRIIA